MSVGETTWSACLIVAVMNYIYACLNLMIISVELCIKNTWNQPSLYNIGWLGLWKDVESVFLVMYVMLFLNWLAVKNDFNRKLSIQRVPKLLFKHLICLALIGENAFLGG